MSKYTIYSKPSCGYCSQAKDLLTMEQLPFDYLTLGTHYSLQEFMELFPNARSFPQIFVVDENGNKELVGGYAELCEYLKQQY